MGHEKSFVAVKMSSRIMGLAAEAAPIIYKSAYGEIAPLILKKLWCYDIIII